MLEKLGETGDRPDEVRCGFDSGHNGWKECSLLELPSGEMQSFAARSSKYRYVATPTGDIGAWDANIVRYLT